MSPSERARAANPSFKVGEASFKAHVVRLRKGSPTPADVLETVFGQIFPSIRFIDFKESLPKRKVCLHPKRRVRKVTKRKRSDE